MIGACFLVWCLGTADVPRDTRLLTTQDVYHKDGATNRLFLVESNWLIGGYAYLPDTNDAVFAGGLPVRIHFFGSRVWFDGGAIVATSSLPRRGTRANWVARAQVNFSDRLGFEVVHISNGGPAGVFNPAIDSVGFSVRLK